MRLSFAKTLLVTTGLVASVVSAAYAENAAAPAATVAPASSSNQVLKVAVVNTQKIMKESLAAQDAKKQLDAMTEKYRKEFQKEEDDLTKKEKDLAGQRSVLSADAFEQKQKEFKDQYMKAQNKVQSERNRIDNALSDANAKIQAAVQSIIEGLAKNQNLDLVIPLNATFYAKDSLDITAEVKKRLDEKLPKVAIDMSDSAKPADKKSGNGSSDKGGKKGKK